MVSALEHIPAAVVAVRGGGARRLHVGRAVLLQTGTQSQHWPAHDQELLSLHLEFPAVGVVGEETPSRGRMGGPRCLLCFLSLFSPWSCAPRSGKMSARPKAAAEVLCVGWVGAMQFPCPCPGLRSPDRPGPILAALRGKEAGGRMQPCLSPQPRAARHCQTHSCPQTSVAGCFKHRL